MLEAFGTVTGVALYMISGVMASWNQFLCLLFVGTAVRGVLGKSTLITMAIHRSRLVTLRSFYNVCSVSHSVCLDLTLYHF